MRALTDSRLQAQMMAKEYKSRGGGYTTDKKDQDESQKHLSKWTEEEWQTKEGSGHAKKDDGTRKRYLPKKAWEDLNEKEKEETEEQKEAGSKGGKQFVPNTSRARSARKNVSEKEHDASNNKVEGARGEEDRRQTRSSAKRRERSYLEESAEEEPQALNQRSHVSKSSGQKRSRGKDANDDGSGNSSSKKPKNNTTTSKPESNGTVGSKHDTAEPPAQQGSKSRLPKKGQTVHWKALPGWVKGTVVEVVNTSKEVDGKQVKAGKNDPRIVLRSSSSGKIAIHKPDSVYFD